MNLTKARELREERARVFNEARTIYEASQKTKEDREKYNAALDKVEALKQQIDTEERTEALGREFGSHLGAPPAGGIDPGSPETRSLVAEFRQAEKRHGIKAIAAVRAEVRHAVEALTAEYWQAARLYLAFGANIPPEARAVLGGDRAEFRELGCVAAAQVKEYRDMGTGGGNALQGAGGGYFVPVGFVDEVEEAMKWYGDMLNSSTIMTTATGQPLPYPTSNDTGVRGVRVGENQQVTEADISIGSILFQAWKYSTQMVKVSLELLQDSAFDLEAFVKQQFGERLGRVLNTDFTVGTGPSGSQPNGILTAATFGATAAGSANNDGGSEDGSTSIGTDDLVTLEHSVDKAYRRGAAFMAHDLTIRNLKYLKDKYGRPIWLPGIAINAPDTILGYEYFTNNDLPTIADSAKTVLFGQLKKYMVRRVKELAILRLSERYADYGQVAFVGFARYDGNLLDAGTHPVMYLQQAAS